MAAAAGMGRCKRIAPGSGEDLGGGRDLRPLNLACEASGRQPWWQGRVLGSSSRHGKLQEDDPGSGEDHGSGLGAGGCKRRTLAVEKTLAAAEPKAWQHQHAESRKRRP